MQKPAKKLNVDTKKDIDNLLIKLNDINQPLNTQLSSILQIVCMLSSDTTLVEYLLKKGANPNYLDARGWDAKTYAAFNTAPYAPLIISSILKPYESNFPKEDPEKRCQEILDWAINKSKQTEKA